MSPITIRIAAELAVSRGELAEALLLVESALVSAPAEHRREV